MDIYRVLSGRLCGWPWTPVRNQVDVCKTQSGQLQVANVDGFRVDNPVSMDIYANKGGQIPDITG